jgi:HEAT repeat protein
VSLVVSTPDVPCDERIRVASSLIRRMPDTAANNLAALSADGKLGADQRMRVALELASVDAAGGIDALIALSADPAVDYERTTRPERKRQRIRANRRRIAAGLPPMDQPTTRLFSYRIQAAARIASLDHGRAVAALTKLARDSDDDVADQALAELLWLTTRDST